jgi:sarcosine oxidase subunit beta
MIRSLSRQYRLTIVFILDFFKERMPYRLLRFGLSREHPEPRMFTRHAQLKSSYDVVIIGAGGHGLAAAYYLARDHGITNVAVLEKAYIGGGNTGRNTTIIRSNYLTPEGVQFYDESLRLWRDLGEDFDLNIFYSTRGHFTLAHTDASMRTMRWRAEVNKHYGIRSETVDTAFVKQHIPMIDESCGGHAPILGALFHEPGAIARHDAVAWGYGRGADRRGVEIHQKTTVTNILLAGNRVVGVETDRGTVATSRVLCAVAGFTPDILGMVGLRSPIYIHPLQAMVSEPVKRWLDPIVVSGSLHAYISQSARGELVMGAALDPYELHQTRSTLEFAEGLSTHILEMFPFLSDVKVNRQWAGRCDMTPDFAPIMGVTPVEGFYLDSGWGTWGFKATPVCGKTMSSTIATGKNHPLIESFSIDRYARYQLTGEKGAAAVGH